MYGNLRRMAGVGPTGGSRDGRRRSAHAGVASARAAVGALALLLVAGCSSSGGDGDGSVPGKPGQRPKAVTPFWVNPDSKAARQVSAYGKDGKSGDARLVNKIATQPVAEWIGIDDPQGEARGFTEAAAKADREALLVLYNIPHRDCGSYSKGGAADGNAYRSWLDGVLKGIGDRATTVILEPDALPHIADKCTPQQFHEERYALLTEAVGKLKALPHTKVYLDAGNPHWIKDAGRMVEPLKRAGIDRADGFALNISNYQTTAENTKYGKKLSAMVGGKPFVIDTSRNGNGPAPGGDDPENWCNPPGRALGTPPTTKTGDPQIAAYLWIKRPGESDGTCKGGPKAGAWWPKYALGLADSAK
ncbi:glycoside hydrolase family 6 protein [Streptomyces sp. G7(2002)]|uniref:glycoside hydrolase family 6 protein n=1 Tax=Streptomyces sp. G7(2002) TaxID=2971798 RepID=UPI00237E33C3|nr:glycoside hydrolase family 6 protein [Streptomyces sp. G7(2002)]WDT59954.1 glycoside hydrolase family 6 protein [Streptomyces sp. G7(2002)]